MTCRYERIGYGGRFVGAGGTRNAAKLPWRRHSVAPRLTLQPPVGEVRPLNGDWARVDSGPGESIPAIPVARYRCRSRAHARDAAGEARSPDPDRPSAIRRSRRSRAIPPNQSTSSCARTPRPRARYTPGTTRRRGGEHSRRKSPWRAAPPSKLCDRTGGRGPRLRSLNDGRCARPREWTRWRVLG